MKTLKVNRVPKFLEITEVDLSESSDIHASMSNCLKVLNQLKSKDLSEVSKMIVVELTSSDTPRRMVLDKLHARYCKLLRKEQWSEILKCSNLK